MDRLAAVIFMALMLAACTPPDEERNIPRVAEGPLEARDKALDVQQTLDEAAARRDRQIDEQAGR